MMTATNYHHPMERVLYQIHHRICTFALRHATATTRKWLERFWLLAFVAGFVLTMITHVTFVYRDTQTLDGRPLNSVPLTCLPRVSGFHAQIDVTHLYLLREDNASSSAVILADILNNRNEVCEETTGTCFSGDNAISDDTAKLYYSYSKAKGFLYLSHEECRQHNISVQHVLVSPTDTNCFGESFLQSLISYSGAHETVMLNWLLGTFSAKGFIYNPRSKTLVDLTATQFQHRNNRQQQEYSFVQLLQRGYHQSALSKLSVVCKTLFLFFIVTTLVSFILRETQERMLEFTHQLQARVRAHRPVSDLVMTHVVENLVFVPIMVGMIFFLIELYGGDKVVAFMVLSIVWVCEAFSVVSVRSSEGTYFFPRIFFMEFTIFHFYFFLFPFGFAYLALASTACGMVHSMLFFWLRYELPAVALGQVTHAYSRGPTVNHVAASPPRDGFSDAATSPTPVRSNRGSGYEGVPLPPVARLPPRPSIARQHSLGNFSVASSHGRMTSRHPSSALLFRPSDDDEDSAVYFLNGEVVVHQASPHRLAHNGHPSHDSSTDGESSSHRSGVIPASISMEQHQINEVTPNGNSEQDLMLLIGSEDGSTQGHIEVGTPRTDNRQDAAFVSVSSTTSRLPE